MAWLGLDGAQAPEFRARMSLPYHKVHTEQHVVFLWGCPSFPPNSGWSHLD